MIIPIVFTFGHGISTVCTIITDGKVLTTIMLKMT